MKAQILIIADGRSPTAQSWIKNIQALDYSVSLISTFPCDPLADLDHFHILPIAFSRFRSGSSSKQSTSSKSKLSSFVSRFKPLFRKMRDYLGPLSLWFYKQRYRHLIEIIQPDIVHALRIPFEGMLASYTPQGIPCLVATWGNDLTLHARGSIFMKHYTRRCLQRVDGLSSDTMRDVRLAHSFGLDTAAPTLVVPGSGGLDLTAIQAASPDSYDEVLPNKGLRVVNPRGLRPGSVHQDVFFAAIPKVLAHKPECVFICPNLRGHHDVETWQKLYGSEANTILLPKLTQQQLWSLFKNSDVYVSPSSHDGTPNTLLEAMACECFPVVGDIESVREWIHHGVNGLLVNPRDPDALAQAILNALDQSELRRRAADQNLAVIQERAAREATRPKIDNFYSQFLE